MRNVVDGMPAAPLRETTSAASLVPEVSGHSSSRRFTSAKNPVPTYWRTVVRPLGSEAGASAARKSPSSSGTSSTMRPCFAAWTAKSRNESPTPTKMARWSGICVVARKVAAMAAEESHEVRRTRRMSFRRPATSSPPMTTSRPPITAMGIIPATGPRARTRTTSQAPAKIPAQRVWAPPEVATPVRESEPPVGSAPKNPPATFAKPWARKSPEASVREPSGFGTAAPIPAAWASAMIAIARPPDASAGSAARSGRVSGGSSRSTAAMSETSSTSVPMRVAATETTRSARRVAVRRRRLKRESTSQAATVAPATAAVGPSQSGTCRSASMIFPIVLWDCGS